MCAGVGVRVGLGLGTISGTILFKNGLAVPFSCVLHFKLFSVWIALIESLLLLNN